MRIGHGYDVHRLTESRELIIGGVKIPWEKGLAGHSDADVLIHAIMDAILGASGCGDIGRLFPDSDPDLEGISSLVLLSRVHDKVQKLHYRILNIDASIIAQKPKMMPFINDMRKNISEILRIDTDQVNIKATTEEGLGFTGSGQGIAAHAVVLIENID